MTFSFENHVIKSLDEIHSKVDNLCERTAKIETKIEARKEGRIEAKDNKKIILTVCVSLGAMIISLVKALTS